MSDSVSATVKRSWLIPFWVGSALLAVIGVSVLGFYCGVYNVTADVSLAQKQNCRWAAMKNFWQCCQDGLQFACKKGSRPRPLR